MDLLDRLLRHDAWTTRQILEICRGLSDEELDRPFDIGPGTIRITLAHMIWNMAAWSDGLNGVPLRHDERKDPGGLTIPALIDRLERAAADLDRTARGIADRNAWDKPMVDPVDRSPTGKTLGSAIAHVITHSMHHRSQLLYMLKKLGVTNLPEGDVLGWEEQVYGHNRKVST